MGLQDGTILVFGTGAAVTYGLVQNEGINETTERAEAKGADGNTVSIQEYDDKVELSLTYLELGTPVSPPAIGTTFTYLTVVYHVSSINSVRTVDGFKTVDITATSYTNLP